MIDSPLALAIIRLPVADPPLGGRDAVLWKFGWWSRKELAELEARASFCDDAQVGQAILLIANDSFGCCLSKLHEGFDPGSE